METYLNLYTLTLGQKKIVVNIVMDMLSVKNSAAAVTKVWEKRPLERMNILILKHLKSPDVEIFSKHHKKIFFLNYFCHITSARTHHELLFLAQCWHATTCPTLSGANSCQFLSSHQLVSTIVTVNSDTLAI